MSYQIAVMELTEKIATIHVVTALTGIPASIRTEHV